VRPPDRGEGYRRILPPPLVDVSCTYDMVDRDAVVDCNRCQLFASLTCHASGADQSVSGNDGHMAPWAQLLAHSGGTKLPES